MAMCASYFGSKCWKKPCTYKHEFLRCYRYKNCSKRGVASSASCLYLHISERELDELNSQKHLPSRQVSEETNKELERVFGAMWLIRRNAGLCFAVAIGRDRCTWNCAVCKRRAVPEHERRDMRPLLRCNMCHLPAGFVVKDEGSEASLFVLKCEMHHIYCDKCLFRLGHVFCQTAALPLVICAVCPQDERNLAGYEFCSLYVAVDENEVQREIQ